MSLLAAVLIIFGLCGDFTEARESSFKDPHFFSGHSTIVHLFEWKWSDIAKECENFLGPNGFGGVQLSPIQENIIIPSRPWWERYQPISYVLRTRSGNEIELANMIWRCNKAGVRVYVDAVINHMSSNHGPSLGTGGSRIEPATKNYPDVPYVGGDFHESCAINNYTDVEEIRNCELLSLHDLNQSNEYVRRKIVDFMNIAIRLGVAGFRIDAAKHMSPHDLEIIYSRLHNLNTTHGFRKDARPFIYQEVANGENLNIAEYKDIAVVTEFKYGTGITDSIRGNNRLKWFSSFGETWGLLPSNDALVFIDNHDTQRSNTVITYKQPKLYKMAVAFMLAFPYGIPRIMSSFAFKNSEQGPPADSMGNLRSPIINKDGSCAGGWICEHRWRQIYNMIGFRNAINGSSLTEWWDNSNNQIAFSRGNAGFIAINAESEDLKMHIHTQLPFGKYCDIISGSMRDGNCTGKTVKVYKNGTAYIEIMKDEEDGVLAIHKNAKLASIYN